MQSELLPAILPSQSIQEETQSAKEMSLATPALFPNKRTGLNFLTLLSPGKLFQNHKEKYGEKKNLTTRVKPGIVFLLAPKCSLFPGLATGTMIFGPIMFGAQSNPRHQRNRKYRFRIKNGKLQTQQSARCSNQFSGSN